MIELLALGVEIRVIQVQNDLALVDAPPSNRIAFVRRVEDWTSVRLEREQITICLPAGIQNDQSKSPHNRDQLLLPFTEVIEFE